MVYQMPQIVSATSTSQSRLLLPAEERSEFAVMGFDILRTGYLHAQAQPRCSRFYVMTNRTARDTSRIGHWKTFRKHYDRSSSTKRTTITKVDIFHYVHGVLHDPVYREKYALNLRSRFPENSLLLQLFNMG